MHFSCFEVVVCCLSPSVQCFKCFQICFSVLCQILGTTCPWHSVAIRRKVLKNSILCFMKFQQKFHLCFTSFNINWIDILNCHLSPLTIYLSALSSLVEDQAARKDCLTSKQSNKQLQNQLKKQTHKKNSISLTIQHYSQVCLGS